KADLAIAAAGSVAFLTQRVGNRIGAMLGKPGDFVTIPARSGRRHATAMLRTLAQQLQASPGRGDLAAMIRRTNMVARRRGLVVVISDFLDDAPWAREIRRLTTRHDVLVVEVVDPIELDIPDLGVVTLVDPETGASMELDTSRGSIRKLYAEAAQAERSGIARAVRGAAADHLVLTTDRDWLHDMVQFVAKRRDRIARMARKAH